MKLEDFIKYCKKNNMKFIVLQLGNLDHDNELSLSLNLKYRKNKKLNKVNLPTKSN